MVVLTQLTLHVVETVCQSVAHDDHAMLLVVYVSCLNLPATLTM